MNYEDRPKLLMVSGGSDSTAMLYMVAAEHEGRLELLEVLHINHLLRGTQSDTDEAFVVKTCEELGIRCVVRRIDIAALAADSKDGMEAVARAARYRAAEEELDALCARCQVDPGEGRILTAHTLDDRVETFLMRSMVGTGPGGLGSIPQTRGRIFRPVLSHTRQELRDYLRTLNPGVPDVQLWRDDPTNDDGSNFRSKVRTQLVPIMRELRPGFERSLERTMDLIAQEDALVASKAESLVALNLSLPEEGVAQLPVSVLTQNPRPLARRCLRLCLLSVNPDARLESVHIERILDGCATKGFVTEVASGIKVSSDGESIDIKRP